MALSDRTKKQKINAITLGVVAFVVIPLFSAVLLFLEHPLRHSLTEMAFDMGHRAIVSVWGVLLIAYTIYTVLQILKESGYHKAAKIFFLVYLTLVEIAAILTGACSDNTNEVSETVAALHNRAAIVMFVGHFVLIGLFTAASFFRNRLQGGISAVLVVFFAILLGVCYIRVSVKDDFTFLQAATALCECLSFVIVMVFLYLTYLGNLLFPVTGKTRLVENNK